MLKFTDVSVGYGSTAIVRGVNLALSPGSILAVMGPSGSGKSTLLKAIPGLADILSGSIESDLPLKTSVGMLFQTPYCFPWRTVSENVSLVAATNEQRKRIHDSLALVGLKDVTDKYPWELSGGMLRRFALVLTLERQAPILLLDEPFGGLDDWSRDKSIDYMAKALSRGPDKHTVLFATHSFHEASRLAHSVLFVNPDSSGSHRIAANPHALLPETPETMMSRDLEIAKWKGFFPNQ